MTAIVRAFVFLCALSASASGAPQAVPARVFFVSNNSSTDLRCALWQQGAWSPAFTLKSGSGWSAPAGGRAELFIRCEAPADGKPYRIIAGERYSILRGPGGQPALHRITA